MNADDVGSFLSRWSRRKLGKTEALANPGQAQEQAAVTAAPVAAEPAAGSTHAMPEAPPEPLPPVESLNFESDFKPFMRPGTEPGVKQAALKQLFKDPHFNVMDGLDTYIEDYSIPDPIPEEMMKKLYQAREHLFSPGEKAAADAEDAVAAAAEEAEGNREAEELQQAFAAPPAPAKDA